MMRSSNTENVQNKKRKKEFKSLLDEWIVSSNSINAHKSKWRSGLIIEKARKLFFKKKKLTSIASTWSQAKWKGRSLEYFIMEK